MKRRRSALSKDFRREFEAANNRRGTYMTPGGKKSVQVDHQTWLVVDEARDDLEVKKMWHELRASQALALSRKHEKLS